MRKQQPPKKKHPVIKVKAYVRRVRGAPEPKKMPVPRKRAQRPPTSNYDPYHQPHRKKADGVFDCERCGASQEFRRSDHNLGPMDNFY
jgi:hypothetical protein